MQALEIYFLTHPRNAGRRDLGCPLAAVSLPEEEYNLRCEEYYRSWEEGKRDIKRATLFRGPHPKLLSIKLTGENSRLCETTPHTLHHSIDETTINYLQTMASLIEGRYVCLDEIKRMLNKILRQRSIDRRRKFIYADAYPRGKPI